MGSPVPTCTSCGKWSPPSQRRRACPACGGELGQGDALRRVEAKAAAEDLTLDEYRQRQWDEGHAAIAAAEARHAEAQRAAEEMRRAQPPRWDHHPTRPGAGSHAEVLGYLLLPSWLFTVLLGVVLLVAFWLVELPAWIPVVATVIGLVGGSLLATLVDSGSWQLLDRLAYRIPWVDRHGEGVWDLSMIIVSVAMPPVVAIVATVVLLATVA